MSLSRTIVGVCLLGLAALSFGACSSKGGGGTGGGSTSTGGPDGGAGTPDCQTYCDTVMASCTKDMAVYASQAICLAACASMPTGAVSDTSGDTVGCRTYHAGAAKSDPATHCPHAGPGGAGYCGSNCDGYCQLVLKACPSVYASEMECQTTCKTFKDMEPFSATDVTGDTLQCRLYHASVAQTDPVHCGHIGTMPAAGTCTDPGK